MKRAALALGMMMVFAAAASAQTVRVEIGDNGVYPGGEWVNCRVSGLDNVPDGAIVTLRVSDMFEREMRVHDGVAEGLIIIPDEAPSIEVEIPGGGRARVAPEDLARLKCVKDAEHTGSVRPDLYEIFGPPEWPASAKRSVVLAFALVLVVAALTAVFPAKDARARLAWVAGVAAVGLAMCVAIPLWLADRPNAESVSIFETDKDEATGTLTTIVSRTHMSQADAGKEVLFADAPPFAPVAAYRGEWSEHPVRMDAEGRVFRVPSGIPSRDAAVSRRVTTLEARPPVVLTDGESVWIWERMRGPDGSGGYKDVRCLFVEYVNRRYHADPRIEALRDGMLRWWRKTRFDGGTYSIGWLDAPADTEDARGVNAGILLVTKGRPDVTQAPTAPLLP